jgi:hypothetical protein
MLYHLVKATYFSKLNNQSIPNFYATKKEKKKSLHSDRKQSFSKASPYSNYLEENINLLLSSRQTSGNFITL